jgi:DNA-directed RNA polymerase subunit M/transcription elongation factor TFIIS
VSFSQHLLHLGVKEIDRGVCIVWRCPRCEALRDYHLIQSRGNISLLGLEFTKPAIMMDLRCPTCAYEIRVAPAEESMLLRVAEITRSLKVGALSQPQYQEQIRSLPAHFVKALRALNETWKCSGCGEENPVTFDSCWNCHQKTAARDVERIEGSPINLPPGGNPWEAM